MIGLPPLASVEGAEIDQIISIIHWFMLILFVGWGVFFTYCLFRFRASKNPKANYHGSKSHASTYVEAGVVIAEAVILLGFAVPFWGKWVKPIEDLENATRVRVVAEQFAWNFHYPGPDGKFGRTSNDLIDVQSNPLGIDRQDPDAKDDVITLNELRLPVNKGAWFEISSKDVIHSFKIPVMRVTQDAIPGSKIPISFTPNVEGRWAIACAQLCGIGHYRMRAFVQVDSQANFDKWMADQVASASSEEVW